MDWNLNPNQQQKMAERVLNFLETHLAHRPVSRSLERSQAVNLHEGLNMRGCVSGDHGKAVNRAIQTFKPQNKARDKWFDAK